MWGIYTILVKPVVVRHPPLAVTAAAVLAGTLPMLLLFQMDAAQTLASQGRTLGSCVFVSFGATVIAFWLWNIPLRVITPTSLALFVHFIPLVAITSSILFWQTEDFTPWLLAGAALVILGVAVGNGELLRRRQGTGAGP
jgi:drug/metabolite transporter (DMT)-like permease